MAFNLGGLAPLAGLMESDKLLQARQLNQLRQREMMQNLQMEDQQQQALALLGKSLPQTMGGDGAMPQIPTMPQQIPQVPNATAQMGGQSGDPGLVRGSWFGNDPSLGAVDRSDSGLQASGLPVAGTAGIALPNRATLGQPFDVTDPRTGRTATLPQTDVGPSQDPSKTGGVRRGVDFTPAAVERLGLSRDSVTNQQFIVRAHRQLDADLDQKGNKLIGQGIDGPTVQDSTKLGMMAGREIDPVQWGRATRGQLVQAIEKADPGADPAVKALAFIMANKILAPEEKMQTQMWAKENQQALQLGLAEIRSRTAERGQDMANIRAGMTAQAAGQRQERGIEAAGERQERGIQAKQDVQGNAATIDPVAKAIANYQQAPLSGWTMRSPWGQQVMAKVYEQNPDYQATQFGARQSAARAFASGRQSDTTRSMSVAIDHLQTAQDLGDALQNKDSRLLNSATNALKTQFGYEGPVDFNTAKMIVADEVTKAVAGGTLSMTERVSMADQLSAASSPEQLKGVITTLKTLLGGQLRGLERQFETGTGQSKEEFEKKLSPQAKEQVGPGTGSVGSMSADQLTKYWSGLSPADKKRHEAEVTARIEQLEKESVGGR